MTPILSLHLSVTHARTRALRDLDLTIRRGEVFGVVGRSGCGKSTLASAIMGLLRRQSSVCGEILYDGRDLLKTSEKELRCIRGKEIALVLQAAASALNPWLRIGDQFHEAWRAHSKDSWKAQKQKLFTLLCELQLEGTEEFLRRYPRQISIGQAQRVLIAMALLHHPRLLILDEPTSALDCVARAEVQNIISTINRETGVAILYISHDLAAVAGICDRIGVLDEGRIVEIGTPQDVLGCPSHPATIALADAFREDSVRNNFIHTPSACSAA